MGEPTALIDPFSEDPLPWTRSLAPWPERGLLVTHRPPERWQLALTESGFLVAELDSAGIQTIALQFTDRRALSDTPIPRVTVPPPRLLQDARLWAQPVAPATSEVDSLLGAADAFLGKDGTRLLPAAVIALGGAWLAGRAWDDWGREMTEPRLLAMQNAAHAAYHVTIWRRKETAELAQALNLTLQADGFTTNIEGTLLAPPPEDAEPPLANKIQWDDARDVPIAAHIEQRLSYLSWGHDPQLTDKLGALAAQPGLARPLRAKELRVLLLTPGHSGSSFRDTLAHALTPEDIAALVKPSQPGKQVSAPPPQQEQTPAAPAQPSEAPSQPQAPGTPAPDAAAAVQRLQAQIGKLEQRLAEVRREMQLEVTGADGRAAARGPKYSRLSKAAKFIEGQLREAHRAL